MEHDITLLEYWRALKRHWKLFLVFFITFQTIAFCYILFTPKIYKSEATLLPIGGSNSNLLQSVIATSPLGGMLNIAGGSSSAGPLLAILKSRTLGTQVAEELHLQKIYYSDLWDLKENRWIVPNEEIPPVAAAVAELQKAVKFAGDIELGTISIEAEAHSPKLAAQIVNTYIDKLTDYLAVNSLTSAKRNRIFLEKQLELNKRLVLETGKDLTHFYENNKVSGKDPHIDVNLGYLLQAEGTQENEATSNNLINFLNEERLSIEKKIQNAYLVNDVPQQVYLEYISNYYQLLKKINALLTEQYELAKVNEAQEDISFTVIDPGHRPLSKYKPFTMIIVLLSFALSLFLFAFVAFFMEHFKRLRVAEHNR